MALDLFNETLALVRALDAAGVDYAVAGAIALAIHGAPRATADIDLLIVPTDLAGGLQVAEQRGFRFSALPMRFADGMEIRRLSKIEGEETLTLDFLLVNENLEPAWVSRVRLAAGEDRITVVSREGLIQMKTWAGRPQDLADIRRLVDLDR